MELQTESEFNSGLSLIYQLDAIEKHMIEATIMQDIHSHYRLLVAYFKTLCNQLTETERDNQIENWDKVRRNYKDIKTMLARKKHGIPNTLLEIFDWWEIQLRVLKQKHGLGMPSKNERYTPTKK